MSYTKQDLVDYVAALCVLRFAEAKLIAGGLLMEDEAISVHNKVFFHQRIERLQNLIKGGRYSDE